MKQAIGVVALIFGLIVVPFSSLAHASSNFVISEIQTASTTSASEEYIQISNTSAIGVDVTGWRIEYFSANPKSFANPSRTIVLNGMVAGDSDYLVASIHYKTDIAKTFFTSTLSSTGGHIRLVRGDIGTPIILDTVGWGTAIKPEGTAAIAPKKGEVLKRFIDSSGNYVDTDNNEFDFGGSNQSTSNVFENDQKETVLITELLPNPASPVSDSVGEFIELYNPNDQPFILKGYKLLTGTTLNHSFTFKDQILPADSYKAYFVSETHTSLSNNGGKVQLQGSDGRILSESAVYPNAPDAQAWAWNGSDWQWSSQPTPNAPNIINSSIEKTSSTTTKPKPVKKTAAKKVRSTTGKVKGATTNEPAKNSTQSTPTPAPLHAAVLAGVGGLALLYGIYEYRDDITNAIRKFRGNRGHRS